MDRILASQRGPALPIGLPKLAMDAMPRAALRGAARGARDQDDNGNMSVANSPGEAAFMRLNQFLGDRLSPDDLAQALVLVQQLLGGSDDNGGTPALAGDRRPGLQSYAERFPHSGRLYRGTYR